MPLELLNEFQMLWDIAIISRLQWHNYIVRRYLHREITKGPEEPVSAEAKNGSVT